MALTRCRKRLGCGLTRSALVALCLAEVSCTPLASDDVGAGVAAPSDAAGSDASDASDAATDRREDVSGADACTDACPALGAARCQQGGVEQCVLVGECRVWATVRQCDAGSSCCDDATAPLADADAADGAPQIPDADYYVDLSAPAGGDGSLAHPFTTITAALARTAADGGTGRRIYVFPGTYSAAIGETFPLVVRNGETLTGAGIGATVVVGEGDLDRGSVGGAYSQKYTVTMLVSHTAVPTRIESITIHSASPLPIYDRHYGLMCDRGSQVAQTIVDHVEIGPGYTFGLLATTSTVPVISGCHLAMTSSIITGCAVGLVGHGCGAPVEVSSYVDVGSADPSKGNTFKWILSQVYAAGAGFWECSSGDLRNNTFIDGVNGIIVNQDQGIGSPRTIRIVGNRFEHMLHSGVLALNASSSIAELTDNVFTGITSSIDLNTAETGTAVHLVGNGNGPPRILKARRNQFVGNDVALTVVDSTPMVSNAASPLVDFGNATEPGENVFRCNSSWYGPLDITLGSGTGTLPFRGNFWDHVPPIVLGTGPDPQPRDIGTDGLLVDSTGAALATVTCPSGMAP